MKKPELIDNIRHVDKIITLRVPEEVIEEVTRLSKERGIPKNTIYKTVLVDFFLD